MFTNLYVSIKPLESNFLISVILIVVGGWGMVRLMVAIVLLAMNNHIIRSVTRIWSVIDISAMGICSIGRCSWTEFVDDGNDASKEQKRSKNNANNHRRVDAIVSRSRGWWWNSRAISKGYCWIRAPLPLPVVARHGAISVVYTEMGSIRAITFAIQQLIWL